MYFTDITNEQLQYFHNLTANNFSIALSDVLHQTNNEFDNKLFKIEEIITDSIYKIYPIFYASEIKSTNPNDEILENKCIICQKQDIETYLTFISNDGIIQDVTDIDEYYEIGDTLTINQFNTIVDLLRKNTIHKDTFSLKQGLVEGIYGNYTFDINSTTILDNGILITDETLTNLGTVKLEDAVFKNATYNLKLKVYHITDVNVCDISDDNIIVDTLTVELENNTAKTIPFDTLGYSYIVGFDAEIEIIHNKPIIKGFFGDILLSSSKSSISCDEVVGLEGQLLERDGSEYIEEGITIYFFKEE